MTDLDCSVGVMAYNEQASVADSLHSILGQDLSRARIAELIVVASGCEDRTAEIVAGIARQDSRVCLVEQERREGKASAINVFIGRARSPILVMAGADVLVGNGSLEQLLAPFDDPAVGMVGARPTPVNDEATFLGHAVHLQWRLHDRIARQSPKLGEVVAFRNVVPGIPLDTSVDEVSIQALISQLGYRLVYEPRALVYNRGPATIADFLRQRRRIYAGHLRVRDQQDYAAPTMSGWRAVRALRSAEAFRSPRAILWTAGTAGLEVAARALGRWDVASRQPTHVWDVCDTTKQQIAEGVNAGTQHNVAVFHIMDFHRQQLEVGLHASRRLSKAVADYIRRELGSTAVIAVPQRGTVIAVLGGERELAEEAARGLVERFELAPGAARLGTAAQITLGYGVIALSAPDPPVARTLTRPTADAAPAPSIAS